MRLTHHPAIVTLTPGPATALVVRNAIRGGRRFAFRTTLGNSTGIFAWALASALGVSALVAASEVAFAVLKAIGAVTLVYLGVQSFRRSGRAAERPLDRPRRSAYREGLIGAAANPKLAVFFVALFPQFVPHGAPVLPTAVAMAVIIVLCDLAYFSILALVVTRAKRAFVSGPWAGRMERVTGTVLVGLGLRLALEPH